MRMMNIYLLIYLLIFLLSPTFIFAQDQQIDQLNLTATPTKISFRGIISPSQPSRLLNHSNLLCFPDPQAWNSYSSGTQAFNQNLIRVGFKVNTTETHLCHVSVFRDDQLRLADLIMKNALLQFSLDTIPIEGKVGIVDISDESDSDTNQTHLLLNRAYILTHFHFDIYYSANTIVDVKLLQDAPVSAFNGDISISYSVMWHNVQYHQLESSTTKRTKNQVQVIQPKKLDNETSSIPLMWSIIFSGFLLYFMIRNDSSTDNHTLPNGYVKDFDKEVKGKQFTSNRKSSTSIILEELTIILITSGLLLIFYLLTVLLGVSLLPQLDDSSMELLGLISLGVGSGIVGIYTGLRSRVLRDGSNENINCICRCPAWLTPIQQLLVSVFIFPVFFYFAEVKELFPEISGYISITLSSLLSIISKCMKLNGIRTILIVLTSLLGYYSGKSKQDFLFQEYVRNVLIVATEETCANRHYDTGRTLLASLIPFGITAPLLGHAIDKSSASHNIDIPLWRTVLLLLQFIVPVGLSSAIVAKFNEEVRHDSKRVSTLFIGFCVGCYCLIYNTVLYLAQLVTNREQLVSNWEPICLTYTLLISLCTLVFMTFVHIFSRVGLSHND